jgi:hypothetical protein
LYIFPLDLGKILSMSLMFSVRNTITNMYCDLLIHPVQSLLLPYHDGSTLSILDYSVGSLIFLLELIQNLWQSLRYRFDIFGD